MFRDDTQGPLPVGVRALSICAPLYGGGGEGAAPRARRIGTRAKVIQGRSRWGIRGLFLPETSDIRRYRWLRCFISYATVAEKIIPGGSRKTLLK